MFMGRYGQAALLPDQVEPYLFTPCRLILSSGTEIWFRTYDAYVFSITDNHDHNVICYYKGRRKNSPLKAPEIGG